jgi:hypothetical protein
VEKTTVYLTVELKRRIAATARARGCSEAAVIRTAIEQYTERPRPRAPLFASGDPDFAANVDDILAQGFGED